jgi:hypothetical protein
MLFQKEIAEDRQGLRVLRIPGQNLLGQNPPFSQTPLAEIKIGQTGLEPRLIGIFFKFPQDLSLGFPVFLVLFEEPNVICLLDERVFPVRDQDLLEEVNDKILMKFRKQCKARGAKSGLRCRQVPGKPRPSGRGQGAPYKRTLPYREAPPFRAWASFAMRRNASREALKFIRSLPTYSISFFLIHVPEGFLG